MGTIQPVVGPLAKATLLCDLSHRSHSASVRPHYQAAKAWLLLSLRPEEEARYRRGQGRALARAPPRPSSPTPALSSACPVWGPGSVLAIAPRVYWEHLLRL